MGRCGGGCGAAPLRVLFTSGQVSETGEEGDSRKGGRYRVVGLMDDANTST